MQPATARAGEPVEDRAAERCDPERLGPERAVADHVACAALPHVERGMAIDRDPDFGKIDPSASALLRAASIALIRRDVV